jgi:hypothetical protein
MIVSTISIKNGRWFIRLTGPLIQSGKSAATISARAARPSKKDFSLREKETSIKGFKVPRCVTCDGSHD